MTNSVTLPHQDMDLILLVLALGHKGGSCEVYVHVSYEKIWEKSDNCWLNVTLCTCSDKCGK